MNGKTGEDRNYNYPTICVSKSPNKKNRLFVNGEPMMNELATAMDDGEIRLRHDDTKGFECEWTEKYKWDVNEARKNWTFGCPPRCHGKLCCRCNQRLCCFE